MPDALQKDSFLTFPQLWILSASAGSGKTTALTKRYVQFLLSDRVQHRSTAHLLAITFTNNAAGEMKQRILVLLKRLALRDADARASVADVLDLDEDTIAERARRVLDGIFRDFTSFQVRTIDSFLSMVFRSSAVDLGFSPTVQIQLQPERLLRQAVRTFMQKLAEDESDLELFRRLTDLADEGRTDRTAYLWDPASRVTDRVIGLYQDIAALGRPVVLPETSLDRERIVRAVQEVGDQLQSRIERSGLPASKHLINDLTCIAEGDLRTVCARKPKTKATNKPKTAAERDAEAVHAGEIQTLLEALNQGLGVFALLEARSHYVPYARTLQMLEGILADTKRRENLIFLEDVNSALRSYMVAHSVPEMYIKLGERIYHYLIDEFQDTSPSQWEALRPLLDNTLSGPGSLFVVGDMKQSIYGFRGADWRIMKRLMDDTVFPSAPPTVRTLDVNYRSKPRLLEAVRNVFHEKVTASEYKSAADATGLSAYQLSAPAGAEEGHVEVEYLQRNRDVPPEFDRLTTLIRDARERGHGWGDIAVLAPTNAAVIDLSACLNGQSIPFVSQSSLDIRNRPVIGEMLALLRFLDAPVDDGAFATFILGETFLRREEKVSREAIRACMLRSAESEERAPLYKSFQEEFPSVWEERFAALFRNVGFLPVYDLVSAIVGIFDVLSLFPDEEASVLRLLACVREFEDMGSNAVRDFVREAAEGTAGLSWELSRPSGQDAVTLMTIHKAKGLGFPVVLVLQYEWRSRGGRPSIRETSEGVELLRIGSGDAWNEELKAIKAENTLARQADELNKLYVALTRARTELYVIIVGEDAAKPPSSFLQASGDPAARPRVTPAGISAPPRQVSRLQTSGRISTEAQERPIKDREIRRGERVHAVLAEIRFVKDAPVQVAAALSVHDSADDDIEHLKETLTSFLILPESSQFFDERPGRDVWCERDVADAAGRLYRIDRCVIDRDTVTVIDYKTGGKEREQSYAEQVRRYMAICTALFPGRTVNGMIAYVDRLEYVSVT